MKAKILIRRNSFRNAVIAEGINPNKDFYELSPLELSKVDDIRKSFGYDGRNYLGRSKVRQFWYSLQKA